MDLKSSPDITVFIAGSLGITSLDDNVKRRILNIINKGFRIVVGDANGVDAAVQTFLKENEYDNVIVFYSVKVRNNIGNFTTQKIETTGYHGNWHTAKDVAMTNECDYGFMIWDGKSHGTNNNIIRLMKQNKKCLVYLNEDKSFLQY